VETISTKTMKGSWRHGMRDSSFRTWMRWLASHDDGDPVTTSYAAAQWCERTGISVSRSQP
jgi:hypothetical protein